MLPLNFSDDSDHDVSEDKGVVAVNFPDVVGVPIFQPAKSGLNSV
ncbi:hypothetical protein KMD26_gp52 [Leuconostoc phage phiMH1]|uniref:Uncharacterized protein n=1 Tax=Leuconostoc phage phiMH1 TaxID=912321 RepID=E3W8G9_9CAUD|nr:hypothetical protein KMD26_gp52 [Leuconostoc phage phiMH1]ADP69236.1 hypothetical protein [Leuconostoc phage phiMH1]